MNQLRPDDIPLGYSVEEFDEDEGYIIVGVGFEHFNKEAVELITWRDRTYKRGVIEPIPAYTPPSRARFCSMRRYDLLVDHRLVHNTHCCKQHGCEYGDLNCLVEHGTLDGIVCEMCEAEVDEQTAFEHEIHRILNGTTINRHDQQFPVLMRIKGLVDHFNGLVALIEKNGRP